MVQAGEYISKGVGVCRPGMNTCGALQVPDDAALSQFESSQSLRLETNFLPGNTGRISLLKILMIRVPKDGQALPNNSDCCIV